MNGIDLPKAVTDQLLAASNDAAIVVDADGKIVYANRRAELLFRFQDKGLHGMLVEELIPDAYRERHKHLRNAYASTPHSRPLVSGLELLAQRADGEQFKVEIALTPIDSENGALVAGTIREIDAVSGSEAYFRTLLETAPDAMVIVDESAIISVVNGQTEAMFGYDRSELLGNPIECLLPERLHKRHVHHRSSYIGSPSVRPMGQGLELVGKRKDGSEFPVEISLSPVQTDTGQFVSSTIRDVTERARMERQINSARKEAERANKANTAFLAAASHDLRQPVQALSLLNGALRRTVKDERALEMIDSQEHSLTAMTNLLNSLLDISKLDSGAIQPELENFRIERLIDRLFAEFGRQAHHKGLEFHAESCDASICSDPSLLSEILQNLVSNAIRYTNEGEVRIRCEANAGKCQLSVCDTGIGIEEDEMESIFQEFHQGAGSTATKEGFGLGLAIVRRLSDLLGISIKVHSVPGEGSTFSVEMDTIESDDDTKPVPNQDISLESQASGLVLLIEDNVNVADAWGMLLEAEGYQIRKAASARETRELLPSLTTKPALIISDYHLAEDSTGVEAIRLVRDRFTSNIPAFVVSGDTSKVATDARPIENCMLFSKPINTDELLRAAASAVGTGVID